MRTYASGLENMLFLCRDFVLRRNIRIATRTEENRQLRPLAASTFGSHHVTFVDFTNRFWNSLVTSGRGIPKGSAYPLAPVLDDVPSGETFGLVKSESAATFGGLFDIKEEDEEDQDLLHLRDDLSEDELAEMMSIDPELRRRPLTCKTMVDNPTAGAAATLNTGTVEARTTGTTRDEHHEPSGTRRVARLVQHDLEVAERIRATAVQGVACLEVESPVIIVRNHCLTLSILNSQLLIGPLQQRQ